MRSVRTWMGLLLVIGTSVTVGYGLSALSEQVNSSDRSSEASASTLPKDVDPDSRNRLPKIKREELDELGKKLYDSRAPGGPTGPMAIRLYSPPLAEYMDTGIERLRQKSILEPEVQELATLVAARKAGVAQETIDIIRYRKPLTGVAEEKAALIQLGREVFGKHKVSSDTFARALRVYGKQGLVNVVSMLCHQAAAAVLLTTFDQQLDPSRKPLLPIP